MLTSTTALRNAFAQSLRKHWISPPLRAHFDLFAKYYIPPGGPPPASPASVKGNEKGGTPVISSPPFFTSVSSEVEFLAPLHLLTELSRSRKHNITGRVQSRLNGILDDADDKTNADDLHGDIVGNAEQGAGHGDQ